VEQPPKCYSLQGGTVQPCKCYSPQGGTTSQVLLPPIHINILFSFKNLRNCLLKVLAHGIVIVSAIGNDGPIPGASSNPADMSGVIGLLFVIIPIIEGIMDGMPSWTVCHYGRYATVCHYGRYAIMGGVSFWMCMHDTSLCSSQTVAFR
jgi:hypothetical protein